VTIAILDCESTGLPNDQNARVVELAAVALHPHRDYAEVDAFSSVIHPGPLALDGYPRNASQRVPLEAILDARGSGEVYTAFMAWCAAHSVTEVFSYNRAFDETMLLRYGFSLPWAGCVMRMARAAMPPRKKDPSLADAATHFGGRAGSEHRALPDARLAAWIFRACRRAS
jgi:DNA polymerase III epsilon subunit-like protein